GGNSTSSVNTQIIAARVNSNGTIGTWTTLNPFSTGRQRGFSFAAINGYLYVYGGCDDESCTNRITTTEYAQINADGSVGTWRATAAHGSIWGSGFAVANGKLFNVAG